MKIRRILALAIAVIMLAALVSCGPKVDDIEKPGTDDSAQTTGDDTISEPTFEVEIKEEIIVVHETEDGRKSTKVLRYPEIIPGEGSDIDAESINAHFRDIAEKQFIMNMPDVDIYLIEDTLFNYEVSEVEITYLSNEFISVKNTVYSMTSLSDYPECPVYTVNMTLPDGEIIDEDEVFVNFNEITSRFMMGDFAQVYGIEDILEQTNYEDMILQYKSDYASYPEIYFEYKDGETSLVLCIDLVAALGSSAGFSIPLSEISEALDFMP